MRGIEEQVRVCGGKEVGWGAWQQAVCGQSARACSVFMSQAGGATSMCNQLRGITQVTARASAWATAAVRPFFMLHIGTFATAAGNLGPTCTSSLTDTQHTRASLLKAHTLTHEHFRCWVVYID